ncbi:hypothetical protein V2W45_1346109 [Cenococcum geophilum]
MVVWDGCARRLPVSREPISTTPRSTIDNSPLHTSCDGKAKETVHFAYRLLTTNTEFSDTIERYYIISETDSDARSDCSIDQPTQEVSSYTVPKATIYQLQSPMEAKRQGEYTPLQVREFPTPENASSSGGNDGGDSDSDSDSDNYIMCDTLPTRKRKRPPPAHTVGRKRHS